MSKLCTSKYSVWSVLMFLVLGTSCTKEEQKGGDITDQLNKKYCNIPAAVNYNWNFPGIEDNSVCYFATDFFVGAWEFIDTVRLADESIVSVDTLHLRFEKVANDETYTKMNLSGWCVNSNILMSINKYYIGVTDTFQNPDGWQLICNGQDSVKVTLQQNFLDETQIKFDILQFKNNTMYEHKGIAIKK